MATSNDWSGRQSAGTAEPVDGPRKPVRPFSEHHLSCKGPGLSPDRLAPEGAIAHSRPLITTEDKDAVAAVLESGMIAEGRLVTRFEQAVSDFLQMRGGAATPSGTSALFLALKACGVGPGDEVVIPTYVCRSVQDAVLATGGRAVLCDVADDWCMTAETVKAVLSAATKAVIVVHPFGIAADTGSICNLGLPVIEDCCQALGARYHQDMVGRRGAFCVLSFHGTKLMTTAEGGMVLTNDPSLLVRLRKLKESGADGSPPPFRQAMSDLQAALGLSQLSRYHSFLQRRRQIAEYYFAHLDDLPIQRPTCIRQRSIFFRFPIRCRMDFAETRTRFEAHGVAVRQGVDCLLHRNHKAQNGHFAGAEACFRETVSLPIYPALTNAECERVVAACRAVFRA